jgi:hypothetical protein
MAKDKNVKVVEKSAPFGGVYLVTFIGAAVYFVQNSEGFWGFVLAILQALVWPGFVVYEALRLLGV